MMALLAAEAMTLLVSRPALRCLHQADGVSSTGSHPRRGSSFQDGGVGMPREVRCTRLNEGPRRMRKRVIELEPIGF